jgi:hypothetical protein
MEDDPLLGLIQHSDSVEISRKDSGAREKVDAEAVRER